MHIAPSTALHVSSKSAKKPPPLWFVTNGDVTVGPVTTNLLVRGVLHDAVPDDCLVRERSWADWRKLDRIREIAALRRAQAKPGVVLVEPTRWKEPMPLAKRLEGLTRELLRARDPSDVLVSSLTEAMRTTGACVGAVYRRRPARSGLVTTCVLGPGMPQRLGREVALDDAAVEVAMKGGSLCEIPQTQSPSGRVWARLGALPACSGIAMVPIACSGRLYAIVELGRPDHEFRGTDFQSLRDVAELAADRLGLVQNSAASRALWARNLLDAPS